MIRIDRKDNLVIVKPSAAVDIQEAVSLHEKFRSGLEASEEILIDLKEAESLDVSCLQLIWSVVLSAKNAGKRVRFAVRRAAAFKELLKDSGFLRSFFPADHIRKTNQETGA